MVIEVYLCPTPGCGSYYGASNTPDLTKELTGPKTEDRHQIIASASRVGVAGKRHSRAECPDCRLRGVHVDRVLRRIPLAAVEKGTIADVSPDA